MKHRLILGTMLAMLMVPVVALAQDDYEEESGQLAQLINWRVDPAKAMDFEGALKKYVESAKQAGLTSDYRWAISQDGWEYTLYFPVANFAYFDDPDRFMSAFKDTPGEAMVQEAMAAFTKAGVTTLSVELIQGVPAWSYAPEGSDGDENMTARVHSFWLKPGVNEQFEALSKDFMAFFKEIGHSYPIYGHRVRFGDASRVSFVEWFDNYENYYGANNLDKRIEAMGKNDAWMELLGRLGELVTRSEDTDIVFRPDLSFWPTETT